MLVDCGGMWELGCHKSDPWILDAEKYAHSVRVRPFAIARAAVTNAEVLPVRVCVIGVCVHACFVVRILHSSFVAMVCRVKFVRLFGELPVLIVYW